MCDSPVIVVEDLRRVRVNLGFGRNHLLANHSFDLVAQCHEFLRQLVSLVLVPVFHRNLSSKKKTTTSPAPAGYAMRHSGGFVPLTLK